MTEPDNSRYPAARTVGGDRRLILALGAGLAALGILFGAFGAHWLRAAFGEREIAWWQTGVDYQMWHAVALVALSMALPGRIRGVAVLMIVGTVLFSGSLYLMALTGWTWLGAVTPLGGTAMILGWLLLLWRAVRNGHGR